MTTLTASSQLTDGCDVAMAHAIDRLIRISTAVAVLAVASVAAYVSYWHAYAVVRTHGESGLTARLEPAHDRWPGLRLQHGDLVCGEARESRASLGPLAARAGDRGHFDGEHGPGLVTRSCRSCGRGLACGQSRGFV